MVRRRLCLHLSWHLWRSEMDPWSIWPAQVQCKWMLFFMWCCEGPPRSFNDDCGFQAYSPSCWECAWLEPFPCDIFSGFFFAWCKPRSSCSWLHAFAAAWNGKAIKRIRTCLPCWVVILAPFPIIRNISWRAGACLAACAQGFSGMEEACRAQREPA